MRARHVCSLRLWCVLGFCGADIVQYTGITSDMPPNKVLAMLNDVYALFDELCDVHGVYKLETIVSPGRVPQRGAPALTDPVGCPNRA